MDKLHPGAKWSFRIGAYIFALFFIVFFGFFAFPLLIIALTIFKATSIYYLLTAIFFLLILFVIIILVEIWVRMSYNRWFYEFTDDGLRLERGVIWKRYSNIPYERIQNVDIHRGIIARMLGFSTVMIQTAGYSGSPISEGHIPAVEVHKAEQIRSFVMKKVTKRK